VPDAQPHAMTRSALAAHYRPGTYGADTGGHPGVFLTERRGLALVHLAGDAADGAFAHGVKTETGCALPIEPGTASEDGQGSAVLWLAPDRWLAVSARHGGGLLEERLRLGLGQGTVAITPVTSGRTVIRVAGARSRDLLAKGCPVDLHPDHFQPGLCAGTLIGPFTVVIHCVEPHAFDVFVARSFARDFWHWLREGAAEFGYRVEPAAGGD